MTRSFAAQVPLTPAANAVLKHASRYAAVQHMVEPEHLLLATCDAPGSVAGRTLRQLGADLARLRQAIVVVPASSKQHWPLSEASQQLLMTARREAQHLGHYQVDSMHLLMAMLYDDHGHAARALAAEGITLYQLRQHMLAGPQRWAGYGWRTYAARACGAVRISAIFWGILAFWLAGGIGLWWLASDQYVRPMTMLFVISGWIVSLCVHEFGHALAAYIGGDDGVAAAGYLSLNPLRYANPLFSIVLPLVFLLAGGIGMPGGAVSVNTEALRSRRWQRAVAAAGPVGTVLFSVLLIVPLWLIGEDAIDASGNPLWPALALLAFLQISSLVFNLLPVPPLDGFGIIAPSLSHESRLRLRAVSHVTLLLLFSILWRDSPIADMYWNTIYGLAQSVGVPDWLVSVGFGQFMGT